MPFVSLIVRADNLCALDGQPASMARAANILFHRRYEPKRCGAWDPERRQLGIARVRLARVRLARVPLARVPLE